MIKLVFSINREAFRITIDGKTIWYHDRMWEKQIRLIPKDEDFIKKIIMSRNRIPHDIIQLFELTKEEQAEYDNAKDGEDLAQICIRDARKKGAMLLKREDG